MKPPTHVEVMCEVCRSAIKVPITCEMAYEHPDDELQVVVNVGVDESVIERHVCKPDGCRQKESA